MHLPVRNIFVAQRVSCLFRDVIASSTQIQHKLFIRTSGSKKLWDLCSNMPGPRAPWYSDKPDRSFYLRPHNQANEDRIDEPLAPAQLCPLLTIKSEGHRGLLFSNRSCFNRLEHVRLYWVSFPRSISRQGLWRNVQLTDPPCEKIVLECVLADITTSPQRTAMISSIDLNVTGGITLGDLIDAACTLPVTSLAVDDSSCGERRKVHEPMAKHLSIDELREVYEQGYGGAGHLYIVINLVGMIIPTPEEWGSVGKAGLSS